ncbi:MAG: hypothetical protein P1Q69_01075 [Candidatus Thorarchaeota archaeon]|nr:hypothetical protein [Candidatus Thorarchaeota archaeon]
MTDIEALNAIWRAVLPEEVTKWVIFKYGSWTIDDIEILDLDFNYVDDMEAYTCRPVDLSEYDSVEMRFDYYMETKLNFDDFGPAYHTPAGWFVPLTFSGDQLTWTTYTISIPTNADYVGFYFESDESIVNP